MEDEFKFFMPMQKDIEGVNDDGLYHVKVGVASGLKDKQGDTLSVNFLNKIVDQLKTGISVEGSRLKIPMDDNHKTGLQSIVGAVHNAWIEKNKVFADFAVADDWKPTIQGLLKIGAKLGGSVKGKATAKNDAGEIDDGFISKIALTDTPAAWDLRGTAEECTMCSQIAKTLNYDIEKSWNGSASNYTDEQYKTATLWCDPAVAAGTMSAKSGCKLPVKDPDGTLNPDGVEAAWGALNGSHGNMPSMPASAIASAKTKVTGYYKQLGLTGLGPLKKSDEDEEELQILRKFDEVIKLGIETIKNRS
jgi:hypothetical protein